MDRRWLRQQRFHRTPRSKVRTHRGYRNRSIGGPTRLCAQTVRPRPAKFDRGDAMALPFPADTFDVATMALVIFFVPDPAKGVAEMVRVVRPGVWLQPTPGTFLAAVLRWSRCASKCARWASRR